MSKSYNKNNKGNELDQSFYLERQIVPKSICSDLDSLSFFMSLDDLIKVNRRYFMFVFHESTPAKELGIHEGYHEIVITYKRSKVVFYKIVGYDDHEFHFEIGSYISHKLHPKYIKFSKYGIKGYKPIDFDDLGGRLKIRR